MRVLRKPQAESFRRLTRFLFSRDPQMRHLAAYLLLQIGGNASPSAADIKKVLGAVGVEADDERLEKLIAELDGKDVNALIAEGAGKLASVRTMPPMHCNFYETDVLRLVFLRSRRAVLSLPLAVPVAPRPPLPRRRRSRRRRKRRSVAL